MASRFRLSAFRLTLVALVASACTRGSPGAAEPAAESACVYLTAINGSHFALGYARHHCPRPGYVSLPPSWFDAVASWSFNARDAGILSAFDYYRIVARLATLDRRSSHGFSLHGGGFWADYKWAEHTQMAYLVALDTLGRVGPVSTFLEQPLLRRGLATPDSLYFEIRQRGLSASAQEQLLALLAIAESALAEQPKMTATSRTLDQAARARPDYEAARRQTFSQFTLDP